MLLGELDLYLLKEGRHHRLWEVLGANVHGTGVRFAVWAPNATAVAVIGDWNSWRPDADPLQPQDSSGVWCVDVPGAAAGDCYKFAVTGRDGVTKLRADPLARRAEHPPATASVVVGPSAHEWDDDAWMASRADRHAVGHSMRVYELHVGSWRPGLGYRELAATLPDYVADLGFTHVELLPVAEHPFGPSWGYQIGRAHV